MRPSVKMDFGDYNPDTADYWNDGATTAQNVLPTLSAPNYSSMQSLVLTAIGNINGSTYTANAVDNNATAYLARGAALTGISNTKQGALSCWFRIDALPASGRALLLYIKNTAGGGGLQVQIDSSGRLIVGAGNSANTGIMDIRSTLTFSAGATWYNMLVDWNLATATHNFYVNNVSGISVVTFTNDTIDYSGTDSGVFNQPLGIDVFNGAIAELWFNTADLDFSSPTNRAKFISGGFPVSLGSSGQTPTGSSPFIYLKNSAATFGTNLGTGGNFTATGVLSIASSSPSDGTPTQYLGAFTAIDGTNTPHTYAGTTNKIAEISATTATDVSKAGGYTAQTIWKFTQFTGLAAGNLVIATDYSDTIQSMTVGGAAFADLGGSPPKASAIATVNQFLMVGDTTGGTYNSTTQGAIPNRVWWSAIGNPANWPDPATLSATAAQSNFKDLPPNLGRVQDIKGRYEYGIVLQENGLSRFQYQGGDVPFYITTYDTERGLYCRNAAIQIGNDVHFLHSSGFYKTDGAQVAPTGHGLVDDTFLADLNTAYRDHVRVSHMEADKCILWAYPSITMTPLGLFPVCDKVIAYNYVDGRWAMGMVGQSIDILFDAKSLAYTMEQLDSVNSNLDLISPSLDDPFWNGGIPIVGAFGIQLVTGSTYASYYGSLTGSDLTATLETKSYNLNQGGRALMTAVKPIVLNGSPVVTCQVGTRTLLTASETYTASLPIEARTGKASCRADGVFHTARVQITGNFDNALGVEPEFTPSGWT